MKLDLQSERDEWMAAKAMTAHYVRDKECTPARAIVRQALEIERLMRMNIRLADALRAIEDAPGGGPARRIAAQALHGPNAMSPPDGV